MVLILTHFSLLLSSEFQNHFATYFIAYHRFQVIYHLILKCEEENNCQEK